MSIKPVDEKLKIRLALYGSPKLYGDFDDRRKMEAANLTQLFDRIWGEVLQEAISQAEVCDSKEAFRKLTSNERAFFDHEQEHREVRLPEDKLEYIAQLKKTPNGTLLLTQLWQTHGALVETKTENLVKSKVLENLTENKMAAKVWSETYYKASLIYKRWYYVLGVPITILAIIASTTSSQTNNVALILSLCVAVLGGLQTLFNFGGQSEKHQAAGAGWGGVVRKIEKDEYAVSILELDEKSLMDILDEITDLMNRQEKESPSLSVKLYKQASARLRPTLP